jgi:ankyrin repeat protein
MQEKRPLYSLDLDIFQKDTSTASLRSILHSLSPEDLKKCHVPAEPPIAEDQRGSTCGLKSTEIALRWAYQNRTTPPARKHKTKPTPAQKAQAKEEKRRSLRSEARKNGFSEIGEIFSVNDIKSLAETFGFNDCQVITSKDCKDLKEKGKYTERLLLELKSGNSLIVPVDVTTDKNRVDGFPGKQKGECSHWALAWGYIYKDNQYHLLVTQWGKHYLWSCEDLEASHANMPEMSAMVGKYYKNKINDNYCKVEKGRLLAPELKTRDLKGKTMEYFQHAAVAIPTPALKNPLDLETVIQKEKEINELYFSAHSGDMKAIQKLIDRSSSALHLAFEAVAKGDEILLRQLLEKRLIDINARNPDDPLRNTLACVAAEKRKVICLQVLNQYKADMNLGRQLRTDNPQEETPIMIATRLGHLDSFSELLIASDLTQIDPDTQETLAFKLARTAKFESGICLALLKHDKSIIEQRDVLGRTLAHFAAQEGNREYLHLLARSDANFFKKDDEKKSPLETIIKNQYHDVVNAVIEKAVEKGDIEALRLLIEEYQVDMTGSSNDGQTWAFVAAKYGNVSVLQFLKQLPEKKQINFDQGDFRGLTPLMIAAKCEKIKVVNWLLEKGADPNLADQYGFTPLFWAVYIGCLPVIDTLLTNPIVLAAINKKNKDGKTALMIAVERGNANAVNLLLEKGKADPNIAEIESMLSLAAEKGHEQIVRLLLDKFINLNVYAALRQAVNKELKPIVKVLLEHKKTNVRNLLFRAISEDSIEIIKTFIELGIDFNLRDDETECTPLMMAVQEGCNGIVKMLLDHESIRKNINAQNLSGQTALFIAAKKNNEQVIKLLLSKGANPTYMDANGNMPLLCAIKECNSSAMRVLLENKLVCQKINDQNKAGQTPFNLAIEKNNKRMFHLLLEKIEDPTVADEKGDTPLLCAVRVRNISAMKVLLENELVCQKINDSNKDGYTALSLAIRKKDKEMVRLLLEEGANPNCFYNKMYSPLMRAAYDGDIEIFEMLLKNKALVNLANNQKATPLHIAVWKKQTQMVQRLLSLGADINFFNPDYNYETALSIAQEMGYGELEILLIQHGAKYHPSYKPPYLFNHSNLSIANPYHEEERRACKILSINYLSNSSQSSENALPIAQKDHNASKRKILIQGDAKMDPSYGPFLFNRPNIAILKPYHEEESAPCKMRCSAQNSSPP